MLEKQFQKLMTPNKTSNNRNKTISLTCPFYM